MYSTLDSIDIVATDKATGQEIYVQTDHRQRDELESEPEITVLFGLTRILKAHEYAANKGAKGRVVYAGFADDPPAFLLELIAVAGGEYERASDQTYLPLQASKRTASELADEAYRGLAKRVQERVGLSDWAAVLNALQAETLTEPPDKDEDQIGYWTRVAELAAVTGELLRGRNQGKWVQMAEADIPFGFQCSDGSVLLPTNRAQRFIADGEDESMFRLIELDNDREAITNGPRTMLPSLRAKSDALREKMVHRALLQNAGDNPDIPVIVYGNDTPQSFGIMKEPTTEDVEKIHAEALANIAKQEVTVDDVEVGGVKVLAVSGSFYATEKLLDVAFMKTLHRRLGNEMLVASVPRRGLMFVANGVDPDPRQVATVLRVMTDHESGTTRSISKALLIVMNGDVVGHVQMQTSEDGEPPMPPPEKKKPSFLRRLFGRA
ncbi:MAG TPA: hypothetical protein VFQ53_07630 [Kofleriaceae bacterium]|nr:hypothetical protein [Kofleriaceae bacterium]